RQATPATLAQAEDVGPATDAVVVEHAHHLALAEMIAPAIGPELADLVGEVGKLIGAQPFKTQRERGARSIVAEVRRVFATLRPFQRNAERVQHLRRRAIRGDLHAERFADLAGLARRTLATARAGRRAFENRIDERATDGFV